jgi:dTDP-4-dehydrorhamnose reductase
MTVLVTGACGLLGAHLATSLSEHDRVVGIDRHAWWGDWPLELVLGDLSSPEFVADTVGDVRPSAIVHCAAMVSVDECERQPERAEAQNAGVTRNLVTAAGRDCLFVYITTDGIFQGDRPFMTENDAPHPRTVYGWSKLHGEQEVRKASDDFLIVRTNFYGWSAQRKQTSAEWLYGVLAGGQPMTGFDDFFFTPIYVVDLVDRLVRLMASPHRGVFHLCGADRVSKYEFAVQVAREASFSTERIARGSIESAGLLAPRPKDMSLSSAAFCRALGISVPGYVEGIRRFLTHRTVSLSARCAAVPVPPVAEP